mgnify:CR=1 FL=1
MVEDSVVAAVVSTVADITEDQVRRVLAAVDAVRAGAAVGTIMRQPKTGAVATRVCEGGVPFWAVTAPDGSSWRDMQPRLNGWTVLLEGKPQ